MCITCTRNGLNGPCVLFTTHITPMKMYYIHWENSIANGLTERVSVREIWVKLELGRGGWAP